MELNNSFEISLRYTSFDQKAPELLKKYIKGRLTQVSFSSIRLPVKKKRYTLLRSPHVNKKSRDQLEVRLYNGLICFQVHLIPFSFLKAIQELMAPYMGLKVSIKTLKKISLKC